MNILKIILGIILSVVLPSFWFITGRPNFANFGLFVFPGILFFILWIIFFVVGVSLILRGISENKQSPR